MRQNTSEKKKEKRTFDHIGGRNGILSTLHVTGCVVEQEEALGTVCLALKDFDRAIDLGDEFRRFEISVAVLARFEHDASLSARRSIESVMEKKKAHLSLSPRRPHSAVKKSETIKDCPSPLGLGVGRLS
jgi:hypothetical protein